MIDPNRLWPSSEQLKEWYQNNKELADDEIFRISVTPDLQKGFPPEEEGRRRGRSKKAAAHVGEVEPGLQAPAVRAASKKRGPRL